MAQDGGEESREGGGAAQAADDSSGNAANKRARSSSSSSSMTASANGINSRHEGAPAGSGSSSGSGNAVTGQQEQGDHPFSRCKTIGDLLSRDTHPREGQCLFVPYFTTTDLLRLSEGSDGLQGYRLYLSRIKLRLPSGDMEEPNRQLIEERVSRMLAGQRAGGLQHLLVDHHEALPVLANVANMGSCKVKSLEIGAMDPSAWQTHLLGCILSRGGLRDIEELTIGGVFVMESIMAALAQRACPGLKKLSIVGSAPVGVHAYEALAAAMTSSHCQNLQELTLRAWCMKEGGFDTVASALEAGSCPGLIKLDVAQSFRALGDWQALERLLRSGACLKLKMLVISNSTPEDGHGLLRVLEALEAEACPDLTHLEISYTKVDTVTVAALARLLVSGSIPHLQFLYLRRFSSGVSIRRLLEDMLPAHLPDLRYLDLRGCHMGVEGGLALAEVLKKPVCPNLRSC